MKTFSHTDGDGDNVSLVTQLVDGEISDVGANRPEAQPVASRIGSVMTDPTIGRIVGWLDEEMEELSRLHMAYEKAYGDGEIEAADALSAAVGKFLVTRGWVGKI